ncbi:PTS sugar transporter subunit IIA [Actinomycetaceae bacterium L2_0104]
MGALSELVTEDRVILHRTVDDWRQAIAAVAAPLIADGSITPAYVQSMIRAVEEFGPYIVLVPHIALAHARPEGAVNRQAMSVMTLAEPVDFGHTENDPVSIVFCLAATDNRSHMNALKSFVAIAGDSARTARLVAATTVAEFHQILDEVD